MCANSMVSKIKKLKITLDTAGVVREVRLNPPIQVDKADLEGIPLQPEPGGQIHGKFRLDTEGKLDWTQLTVSLLPVEENGENGSEPLFGAGGMVAAPVFSGRNSHSAVSNEPSR